MKSIYLTLIALFVAIGCGPKDGTTPEAQGSTTASSNTTTGSTTTGTTGDSPEPAKMTMDQVPAAAKTSAFEYFGLAYEKPMDVELRQEGMPAKTGGVAVALTKVEGGKAWFTVARTGGIAEDLGDDTVIADSTGVYMAGNSTGTVTPSQFLALPADLTPGKTWKQKTRVVRNDGREIEEDSTYKVVGEQDVKTKNGTQKALLVTSTGTAVVSMGGKKETPKYETKSWYVKGIGAVKIEIILTLKGQKPQTLTVEQSS